MMGSQEFKLKCVHLEKEKCSEGYDIYMCTNPERERKICVANKEHTFYLNRTLDNEKIEDCPFSLSLNELRRKIEEKNLEGELYCPKASKRSKLHLI